MVKCPVCNKETTELDVNRHLDKGCPSPDLESKSVVTKDSQPHNFFQTKTKEERDATAISSSPAAITPTKRPVDPPKGYSKSENTTAKPDEDELPKKKHKVNSNAPLADQIRPQSLEEFIGQSDLVGPEGILRKFIETGSCPSFILWGPSGVGKTSFARVSAVRSLRKISTTKSTLTDRL
jgi:putative ATPase